MHPIFLFNLSRSGNRITDSFRILAFYMTDYNLITVTGPTASGKTSFAAHLAHNMQSEIISADSRQIYRKMDIGTGKDLDDYQVGEACIPYHMIDIHDPGYQYNVYEFQKDFFCVYQQLRKNAIIPILAGGTGLYIEAVLNRYQLVQVPVNQTLRTRLELLEQDELVEILQKSNQELHNTTDVKHKKRTIRAIEIAEYYKTHPEIKIAYPEIYAVIFGIKYDRKSQRSRISERLRSRLSEGLIEEVQSLLAILKPESLIYYGLEYKFITLYLTGKLSYEETFAKLQTAIHQFAKRQMTWFRKMERQGYNIHWLDGHMPMDQKIDHAKKILRKYNINF